ncbi:MAG TPA: GntR family transcriptional regulator [Paracoccus sp. (in: a-proteobacteria)]|uniref:GntR family transcriptional regulator n=1 Tax=Paracoccus sp. TaxID=267 RepID=UPI002BF13C5E|nr:GntR family transcriptional regulator [Paracoccus sp. (in: a-proteobacteria)]HWL57639.1 GntR family transcriptional regulator [Paracoccus sp. (in: a-proteobacteria)]
MDRAEQIGAGQNQTVRAAMTLRDMIIGGKLQPDLRYTETQLAGMLSMSRTPIRAALQRMTDEGLLTQQAAGGYVIRQLSPVEIGETIELRGTLEGLCARFLAERGAPQEVLNQLRGILAKLDTLLEDDNFDRSHLPNYERLNAQFHRVLVEGTGSSLLIQEIERANNRPFASASSLVGMYESDRAARQHLRIGQDHHRTVIEAIAARQSARAEAIMREHARLSLRNLTRAVESSRLLDQIRGASLIRQPGDEPG